ncbi:MAG: site-specific DNA-methyltransferase [Actinomycetota bacterium]|nr:site-specific DNA-methyltransferase [Actinomycetota bacterium]
MRCTPTGQSDRSPLAADGVPAAGAQPPGWSPSVWACAQRPPRTQRGGRYVAGTTAHPARMLPDLAAHAINSLTVPGDVVFDPMCGAGTTLIEALRLGRHAVGVDVEARWASLARENIAHTRRLGVGGYGHVLTADARTLPDVLPPDYREQLTGRVALVLTSPPYGLSTHGQVTARPGKGVAKADFRYSARAGGANLAYLPMHRLLGGLTAILRGCIPLLAPGGYVVLTARPWRHHGELIDLPAAVTQAGVHAGLVPVQRCVAMLSGLRGDGQLVSRASFFQRTAVTKARAQGLPWHAVAHEDVLIFTSARTRSRRRDTAPTSQNIRTSLAISPLGQRAAA